MNPDVITVILAQIPILIGLFALWAKSSVNAHDIKNAAAKVTVDKSTLDNSQNVFILAQLTSMTARLDVMQAQAHESALRENAKDVRIAALEATVQQKDEALGILRTMVPQVAGAFANSTLANQQLSTLQHTVAVNAQPDDTIAADAALLVNRAKDHEAKQGIDPVSPMIQEVPPLPTPPKPAGAIDPDTGEAVKIA